MVEELVIAIDPGREKCGVAVVHKTRGLLHKEIVPTSGLVAKVAVLLSEFQPNAVILGNRTSSQTARQQLNDLLTSANEDRKLVLVDEHRSTDEARTRYWQENPPQGWKRLIPVTMQVPSVPVDDYVAVILAERYFQDNDYSN
jgi:RNase H-fold protein (predicted Holliday junction resolvase)